MTEKDILLLIQNDLWMMKLLSVVRSLNLPDAMIGAGFVRNKVWDYLHGYENRTPLNDIDVIYFDPSHIEEDIEKDIEKRLLDIMPGIPWSVKNQARMHLVNGEDPYLSSADALSRWPETVTCIAVRLDENNQLELIQPHGITDLVNLKVNPSPAFRRNLELYRDRIARKNWKEKWPKLNIEGV